MASVSRDLIESSLLKKGFVLRETDHRYYHFYYLGKKTSIRTKISKGSAYKEYDDNLLGLMAKQVNLTKKQLLDLINCPLSQEMYITLLKDSNNL